MTVLVTGGAGDIGSHMVPALVAAEENLGECVTAAHKVESIIHFAGSVVVPASMRDPLGYYRNNTMTTRSLLNAAVKCGISRFIFSSTAAVYGKPDQVPVPEDAPTRPLSPYGSSKLMTEIRLHA